MEDIAFIDLEASGLSARSWPIEVGWCFQRGAAKAMLIRPHEDWSMADWSSDAEALHGVSHDQLVKQGAGAKEVCEKLNADLAGKLVYSDAPDWDGFWLYRLFQAVSIRQRFLVHDLARLFRAAPPEKLDRYIAEAQKKAPRSHRAAADALHLRALHQLMTS